MPDLFSMNLQQVPSITLNTRKQSRESGSSAPRFPFKPVILKTCFNPNAIGFPPHQLINTTTAFLKRNQNNKR